MEKEEIKLKWIHLLGKVCRAFNCDYKKYLELGKEANFIIFILMLISSVCQEITQSPAQLFFLDSFIEV